jgi:regulator of PEP synthase PpsR (kinase-PPPase family)
MFADEIHALVRKRSIAYGISQAVESIHFQILDLLQYLLESLEVAMDIGEDSNEHAGASDG